MWCVCGPAGALDRPIGAASRRPSLRGGAGRAAGARREHGWNAGAAPHGSLRVAPVARVGARVVCVCKFARVCVCVHACMGGERALLRALRAGAVPRQGPLGVRGDLTLDLRGAARAEVGVALWGHARSRAERSRTARARVRVRGVGRGRRVAPRVTRCQSPLDLFYGRARGSLRRPSARARVRASAGAAAAWPIARSSAQGVRCGVGVGVFRSRRGPALLHAWRGAL